MADTGFMALLRLLPLVFAFGFLVPLVAQALQALGWSAPLGFATLQFAFMICGAWGLVAVARRRWI
jgi:hypothetical protein